MNRETLKIMVLAGGPDREHEVSLMSGCEVAAALERGGHEVRVRDIGPDDLSALDEFASWPGDAVFPALHGRWGEGGGVQRVLDARDIAYVGCRAAEAELCMDKHRTKLALEAAGLPTPPCEVLTAEMPPRLDPPVVVKPVDEGSSIDLAICRTAEQVAAARRAFHQRHARLMIERFIAGKEITVGIVGGFPEGERALPPIHIIPAVEFYDYDAKYVRDDTRYLLADQIDLPASVLDECERLALSANREVGARHLSRWDFIVDDRRRVWILELNTIPGFTTHSLVPMAARHAGHDMAALVNRLVRLALTEKVASSGV